MCFNEVRNRAKTSLYINDPAALRRDISLIFDNAMKFNLPKHKVHKEAARLGEVCVAVMDSVWSSLVRNAARTKDELLHRDLKRVQRKKNLVLALQERGQRMIRW